MDFPTTLKDRTANSKKPGRRSQPRTAEDEPGIPCDECGKEFRYDDSSSIYFPKDCLEWFIKLYYFMIFSNISRHLCQ